MTTTPLQAVPARVRQIAYWVGYVVGVLGQGLTIVWAAVAAASPDVVLPLWLVVASAVLGLAQTQLNLLAGTNVVTTPVVPARDVVVVRDHATGAPVAAPGASTIPVGAPVDVTAMH